MTNKIIKNKYLLLSVLSITLLIISGLFASVIIENYSQNWENEFKLKENEISVEIQSIISKNESEIFSNISEISQNILQYKPKEISDYLENLSQNNHNLTFVNIFKNNQIVGWNKTQIISNYELKENLSIWGSGKAFFFETPLTIYLASISEIESVQIFVAIPIQRKYELKNEFYQKLNLEEEIIQKFDASISINFNNESKIEGVSDIKNKHGNPIGSIKINAISKNAEVEKLQEKISFIQNVLVFLAVGFFLLGFYSKIDKKHGFYRTVYFTISIIIGRILMSIFDFGNYFSFADLTNPSYFSSTFAFGLTKSPIELFFTVISVLIISQKIFFTISKSEYLQNMSSIAKAISSFFAIILLILLYNGFASTLKSIIFDSSILYFKDASISASFLTIFMYLNIILVGLITLLVSLTLVLLIINFPNPQNKKKVTFWQIIVFLITLIIVFVDEFLFNKSSILLSLLFVIFVFGLTYFWFYYCNSNFTKAIIILFSSSIISITFLNFYNSKLEINSLKTIASEITRSDVDLYQYYVDDALRKISFDENFASKMAFQNSNFNAEAFLLWTKSFLSSEVQSSQINIIDANRNLIGSFEYRLNKPFIWNWGNYPNSDIANHKIEIFDNDSSNTVISAIIEIKKDNLIVGFVEISAVYDAYKIGIDNNYKLISSVSLFKKLSVNLDLLKIYEFRNQKLSNYFTNIFLTKNEENAIKNSASTKSEENWEIIKLNGENNTFYLKKYRDNSDEILLAVGLSNKDISWSLFDFFKVFFIHSILILFVLGLFLILNYKNWHKIRISFKSKILISLLIVSILPMIFLASYLKNITDEKNEEAINYKLGKRADSVKEYLNTYINSSSLNVQSIFDKATKDLGINYSIYENENLIYSSQGTYYKIGILPIMLNPEIFLAFNKHGMKEVILKENVDNYYFNTLYHNSNINGVQYIVKVSDLFNNYQLPMSGIELNVFLFGTYSLAIIFIIILSTILANQISSPIEKLTKATRSVGSGDMEIQLPNNENGEVKELIDGFNQMVRELKKNQIQLAEVERESAWREMAKQVAHEIKNPLTPMKLAVQHLVAAHNDKSEKYNSIFEKVTSTIINQIDILKNIASEFSNFAKMPSLKLEEVEIVKIIRETVDLFIDEDCTINLKTSELNIKLLSDKEQFQRMIINLVRNSIQANSKNIEIMINKQVNLIELLIKDDGDGIERGIVARIFEDNFTTKTTGMGLGLALIRRFLHQTNGEISIAQTSENGTIIKIEIKTNA